ncbi:hypothetical protein LguiB_012361 [Lonicera macranthoides]
MEAALLSQVQTALDTNLACDAPQFQSTIGLCRTIPCVAAPPNTQEGIWKGETTFCMAAK